MLIVYMAKIAGTLSIAKRHPTSMTISATNRGVVAVCVFFARNAHHRCDRNWHDFFSAL
jgi:hypothetical protein